METSMDVSSVERSSMWMPRSEMVTFTCGSFLFLACNGEKNCQVRALSITFPLGILSLAVRPVVGKVVRGYLLPPFAAYF